MKAFDNYWEFTGLNEKVYYVPDAEEPKQYLVEHLNLKNERAEGWKAALEWLKSNTYKMPTGQEYLPLGLIEEELNS